MYETLRHFADSWFLLAMMAFFIGMVLYTLRPNSQSEHDDIAEIPFRNEAPRTALNPVEPAIRDGEATAQEKRNG